ncbi:hypothetical protein LWI29_006334 [Acer saccharum]|uniref:Uncharacterized protein n=1 Tax=Acer saccharum TaxID=4024 RepID=A0AA39TBZ5_ACESA|nr:hypothetical protein LWI29_006334 [Acer saccharum]
MGNDREQPYLVSVDTNLSVGPQFVSDNYEEDNGRQRVDDEVDNDDNNGGQSRPKQKKDKPVKRKMSPRKQKMTNEATVALVQLLSLPPVKRAEELLVSRKRELHSETNQERGQQWKEIM